MLPAFIFGDCLTDPVGYRFDGTSVRDGSGRNAGHDGVRGHIPHDYGSRRHNTAATNCNAIQYAHTASQPAIVFDRDTFAGDSLLINTTLRIAVVVIVRVDARVGGNEAVASNCDVSRPENTGVRTDERSLANLDSSLGVPCPG